MTPILSGRPRVVGFGRQRHDEWHRPFGVYDPYYHRDLQYDIIIAANWVQHLPP
jgi:hypothetical protein